MKIILASTSPYRAENLRKLTPHFTAIAPQCDEEVLKKEEDLPPVLMARKLAEGKAQSLASSYPKSLIIGSDQIVSLGREVLSKPVTHQNAVIQLKKLSNQTHTLYTGLCVIKTDEGGKVISKLNDVIVAEMTMYGLTEEEISEYLLTDKPYQCAGSYMIEETGIKLFKQITCNDFTAIIGLPLLQTNTFLRDLSKA
jgi:septum formation protein